MRRLLAVLTLGAAACGASSGSPDATVEATGDAAVDATFDTAPDARAADAAFVDAWPIDAWPIDGGTIDATPSDSNDIAVRLAAIDGMTVAEVRPSQRLPGYRYFDLHFTQPADHGAPDGAAFRQYITLAHRDVGAPMVLHTHGYRNRAQFTLTEPAKLVAGNQITVEHRFFSSSRPVPTDWTKLTIRQAADDVHRVVTALKPIYDAAWISTGVSKNGITALLHRRYYPDDVAATVAYVAPMATADHDPRFATVLDGFGDAACRDRLKAFQRAALTRRTAIEQLAADTSDSYRLVGIARATETAIVEAEWAFWQYLGASYCDEIPSAQASDRELYAALAGDPQLGYRAMSPINTYADPDVLEFEPYVYQSMAELGYPGLNHDHLDDLLRFDYEDLTAQLPTAPAPTYDGGAVRDALDWIARDGERLLLIYGQWDPWTAGQVALGDARDSRSFTAAGIGHWAKIQHLTGDDQAAALDRLSAWTGVTAGFPQAPRPWQRDAVDDLELERHGIAP